MQIFKDRVPYSAIVDRPAWKLPDGKRMAVWIIANVEDWDISRPDAAHGSAAAHGRALVAGSAQLVLA